MQKSKDSSKACCENVNAFWTLVGQQRDNFLSRSAMFLISFRKLFLKLLILVFHFTLVIHIFCPLNLNLLFVILNEVSRIFI